MFFYTGVLFAVLLASVFYVSITVAAVLSYFQYKVDIKERLRELQKNGIFFSGGGGGGG